MTFIALKPSVQHDYEELGFFLAIDRDRNGNIIRRIERNGPADRAGLRDGDRILGILLTHRGIHVINFTRGF